MQICWALDRGHKKIQASAFSAFLFLKGFLLENLCLASELAKEGVVAFYYSCISTKKLSHVLILNVPDDEPFGLGQAVSFFFLLNGPSIVKKNCLKSRDFFSKKMLLYRPLCKKLRAIKSQKWTRWFMRRFLSTAVQLARSKTPFWLVLA